LTITFTITELTDFYCRYGLRVKFNDHLVKTIENTRKVGIGKLEAMVQQEIMSKELFNKIKMVVENPQFKIIIK